MSRDNVEVVAAHLWTLRDGRILHMQSYQHEHEAVEAVGLRE
jgi:hypothetical protein